MYEFVAVFGVEILTPIGAICRTESHRRVCQDPYGVDGVLTEGGGISDRELGKGVSVTQCVTSIGRSQGGHACKGMFGVRVLHRLLGCVSTVFYYHFCFAVHRLFFCGRHVART